MLVNYIKTESYIFHTLLNTPTLVSYYKYGYLCHPFTISVTVLTNPKINAIWLIDWLIETNKPCVEVDNMTSTSTYDFNIFADV